jgi:hypothetical protein
MTTTTRKYPLSCHTSLEEMQLSGNNSLFRQKLKNMNETTLKNWIGGHILAL